MLVYFNNVYYSRDLLNIDAKDADLIVVNYHNKICFSVTLGLPDAFKAARSVSLKNDCALLIHCQMNIEGDDYLSTLFIYCGEIVGVADCISKNGFVKGKALRTYRIEKDTIGIAVDEDVKYSLSDNLFVDADTVFHNSLSVFDKEYFKAYKCHCYLKSGRYFGLFSDCAIIMEDKMTVLPQEGFINLNNKSRHDSVVASMHNVTGERSEE